MKTRIFAVFAVITILNSDAFSGEATGPSSTNTVGTLVKVFPEIADMKIPDKRPEGVPEEAWKQADDETKKFFAYCFQPPNADELKEGEKRKQMTDAERKKRQKDLDKEIADTKVEMEKADKHRPMHLRSDSYADERDKAYCRELMQHELQCQKKILSVEAELKENPKELETTLVKMRQKHEMDRNKIIEKYIGESKTGKDRPSEK